MTPLRILLVEDDATIAMLLAEILVGMGHSVCASVATEDAAVSAAAFHGPDLMMVDVHLAVGSGVSAMRSILRTSAMPHVFMTAALESVPLHATVLQKPFGEAALALALASALHAAGPATGLDPTQGPARSWRRAPG